MVCEDKRQSEVTDLVRSGYGKHELYVSGHSDGSIIIVKNPNSRQIIHLKEADKKKILSLKISGNHVVALQQTNDKTYKIIVYDIKEIEKNKEVYFYNEITY